MRPRDFICFFPDVLDKKRVWHCHFVSLPRFFASRRRLSFSFSLSLLLRLPLSVPFVFLSLGLGSSTRGALLSWGEAGRRYIQGVAVVAEVEVEVVWMCGLSVEERRRSGAAGQGQRRRKGGRREKGEGGDRPRVVLSSCSVVRSVSVFAREIGHTWTSLEQKRNDHDFAAYFFRSPLL